MISESGRIRLSLGRHRPLLVTPDQRRRAAVALLLREGSAGAEIFLIQRARHRDDPWSGDLGFPGGRVEPDETPERTAVRETAEEVGLDLKVGECLGRIDDLAGAHLPIVVSCFVYLLSSPPAPRLNEEVEQFFWFPLSTLLESRRHRLAEVRFRGRSLIRPAIDLLGPDGRVLWGITYRLVARFLEITGRPLPPIAAGP